ncbi:MAG: hypothetical protein Q8J96_13485 [Rhodocyclaceae bacterium]|nr:hypothetical protein [Rhodocyclaceae bacterium]
MSILTPAARQLIGERGLALDDEQFAQTIAGMGMFISHRVSGARGPEDFIGWSPDNFRISLEHFQYEPSQSYLGSLRDKWLTQIAASPDKRVLISAEHLDRDPDIASIVSILNQPAVQATSVFIEKYIAQADLRWQWPLRIGGFEDDLDRLDLFRLADVWPANTLAVVNPLSREAARSEILAMQGGVRDSLRRLLAVPHQVRTGHIVLIGPVDVVWRELSSHVESLLSETQAGALSLIACPPEEVGGRFNKFIEELSHNLAYDLALAVAFPRESSIHLVDFRLVDTAALTTVARDLGRSLQEAPLMAMRAVPEEVLRRANIGWTSAKPPAALGVELVEHAAELSFGGESQGATSLREIATAERSARRDAARSEPSRLLQGDLFRLADGSAIPEMRGFIVGRRYRLDVFIGPGGEGAISADEVFDDTLLDWKNKHSHTLQVMFADPEQWDEPLTGKLVLPREGMSSRCPLLFVPGRPGPFSGRVTIYHRGRILQTALLKSTVYDSETALAEVSDPEPLRFRIEAEIRRSLGTLDDRRRFDACMVLNNTTGNKPAATTGSKDGAYISSLDTVAPQLAAINSLMNDVANDAQHYAKGLMSKENAELLCNLAMEGNWVFRNLVLNFRYKSSAAEALRNAEHLQIVSTHPDEPVPLEFVYDYPPPKEGAPVCKNALQALKTGRCPSSCKPRKSPAPHVCPLGFWGLSRVIERHQIEQADDEHSKAAAVVRSEPIEGRDILPLQGASLVAASKQVPAAARADLEKAMKASWGGEVVSVKKWEQWVTAVHEKRPVMLLALPHTAGSGAHISLEISGKTLKSAFIDQSYVKAGPADHGPLVILFGCDTANVADTEAYTRHVTVFRQADAALVLGTVGTVLGEDAAKVAAKIVEQLVATSTNSTERFGEVLRQVKRDAVADSLMLAMCLVAFGDADWRLK